MSRTLPIYRTLMKATKVGEAWAACVATIGFGEGAAQLALTADPGRFLAMLPDDSTPAQLSRKISDATAVVRNLVSRYAAPSAVAAPLPPSWQADRAEIFRVWVEGDKAIGRAELAADTWLIRAFDSFDPQVTDYLRTLGEKGVIAGGIQAVGDLAGGAANQVGEGLGGALAENPILLAIGLVALYVVLK